MCVCVCVCVCVVGNAAGQEKERVSDERGLSCWIVRICRLVVDWRLLAVEDGGTSERRQARQDKARSVQTRRGWMTPASDLLRYHGTCVWDRPGRKEGRKDCVQRG